MLTEALYNADSQLDIQKVAELKDDSTWRVEAEKISAGFKMDMFQLHILSRSSVAAAIVFSLST